MSVQAETSRPLRDGLNIVKFNGADRTLARQCAKRMIANADKKGYKDRFGTPSEESHYIGALGELAFARFLGVEWKCHPADIGGRPDVEGWEVRTVASGDKWLSLKSKANDRPNTRCVLVALVAGRDADNLMVTEAGAIIYGWAYASEVHKFGRRLDPGNRGAPAWFLNDLRLLRPFER